jgi:hypothetical protein
MVFQIPDHFLRVTDPIGFLAVNQGIGNPSQMKKFHPKPFVKVSNNCLWQDLQGSGKSARYRMWVPL